MLVKRRAEISARSELFYNYAPVKRLYRAIIIVMHNLFELVELLCRKRQQVFQHKPGDPFAAGRRGQRAAKAIVGLIFRQQFIDINSGLQWLAGVGMVRQRLPELRKLSVFGTGFKHHRDDCNLARRVFMHQVHFQIVMFAVQRVFTRRMEMELLETIRCAINHNAILRGFRQCGLNGVTVIEDQ